VSVVPTVLLLRHGRTTANASGTLAGWTPGVGLDEVGLAQARAVGERLAAAGMPLARIVSSPLQRCQETAAAVLAELAGLAGGVPGVETDDRLGECRYGGWTGRPLTELAAEPLWRTVQDHPSAATFPPSTEADGPAAESIAAMAARIVAAVRETDAAVDAAYGPRAVWLAVSHGDPIKALLADAAGTHLDHFQRIHVDPGSISVVRYTERRPFVVRVNDVGGSLAGLIPPEPAHDQAEQDAPVGGGAGPATGAG